MTTYIGNGWENEYGLTLLLNIKQLQEAIDKGEATINEHDCVRIYLNKKQTPHPKSNATHYLSLPKPKI